jgi:hypothetical protein
MPRVLKRVSLANTLRPNGANDFQNARDAALLMRGMRLHQTPYASFIEYLEQLAAGKTVTQLEAQYPPIERAPRAKIIKLEKLLWSGLPNVIYYHNNILSRVCTAADQGVDSPAIQSRKILLCAP